MGGMPPPPPPPPTQCYPLYSLYSPPHSTIRQRMNCRSASFFGSCFATAVPHLSGVTTHDSVRQAIGEFFFGGADFFSAKRLFFRAARDVSGAHSEPPWARLGKNRKRVFGFIPIAARERASALTSPPPDFLFSSIHPNPTIHPNPHHPSKSHHPTIPPKPHQIKQPLSKIAVNEIVVISHKKNPTPKSVTFRKKQ